MGLVNELASKVGKDYESARKALMVPSGFAVTGTLPADLPDYATSLPLNAPFLEPDRNMDQQIVNKTPYRRKHSSRRRVNQVENILRPGPFR